MLEVIAGKKNEGYEELQALKEYKKALQERFWQVAKRNESWEKKRQDKLAKRKQVVIVFVCTRPSIWGSLKTACEAFLSDPKFKVYIVAIPNKKQLPRLGFNHEHYIDEGAYAFFKDYPCRVINGYDFLGKAWFDLKGLDPDYVFFQTPYNVCRPLLYQSSHVASYAKICYSNYGIQTLAGEVTESVHPPDFMRDIGLLFAQTKAYHRFLLEYYARFAAFDRPSLFLSGEPRFDTILGSDMVESPLWPEPRQCEKCFRVVWTPRWSTREGNSYFFDFKDKFLEFCDSDKGIDFVFRPHPQAFLEYTAVGAMSPDQVASYETEYANRANAALDTRGEYQDTFISSDVLVTDVSSIIHEYAVTGKPVVYCHKVDCVTDFTKELLDSFYWARSWDDVVTILNMLKAGEDPMKEKRQETVRRLYYFPEEGTAGMTIKKQVMEHFFCTNSPVCNK